MKTIILEDIKLAFKVMSRYRLRSFLTIIGVIIGMISVMLVSSIISGIRVSIEKQIESSGTNTIFISSQNDLEKANVNQNIRIRKPFTVDDAEAIRKLSTVESSVPVIDISTDNKSNPIQVATSQNIKTNSVNIVGSGSNGSEIFNEIIIEGRWFTDSENLYRKNVAVINSILAEDLFPDQNSLNKEIKINGIIFKIIGILEKRGQMSSNKIDARRIYIPLRSALHIKPNTDSLYILVVAKPNQLQQSLEDIEDLLRVRRNLGRDNPRNFLMTTAIGRIERFNSLTSGVVLLMIGISAIALSVSGVGVMNIMLVSVTERTMEIGLRKTVGAKQRDIMIQFLIEAAAMTGIGGIIGLVIGWILTIGLSFFLPSELPFWAPIAGLIISIGTGLIFGFLPAWKAARLNPITALRFE